jgi:hypothetical protein
MRITFFILVIAAVMFLCGCPFANASDGGPEIPAVTQSADHEIVTLPKPSHTWHRFGRKTPFSRTLRGGFGR